MTRPSAAQTIVNMFAGALAGAVTGVMAGPVAAAFGAVIGSAMGASAGVTIECMDAVRRRRDARLDRDIGVSGGELGAPNLSHPPPSAGLYSSQVAGTAPGGVVRAPNEGPIPEVES